MDQTNLCRSKIIIASCACIKIWVGTLGTIHSSFGRRRHVSHVCRRVQREVGKVGQHESACDCWRRVFRTALTKEGSALILSPWSISRAFKTCNHHACIRRIILLCLESPTSSYFPFPLGTMLASREGRQADRQARIGEGKD